MSRVMSRIRRSSPSVTSTGSTGRVTTRSRAPSRQSSTRKWLFIPWATRPLSARSHMGSGSKMRMVGLPPLIWKD